MFEFWLVVVAMMGVAAILFAPIAWLLGKLLTREPPTKEHWRGFFDLIVNRSLHREIVSVGALAACGAVIIINVVGLCYAALFLVQPPPHVDIIAASAGWMASFLYLTVVTHTFQRTKNRAK
jgi:hypothetical protein